MLNFKLPEAKNTPGTIVTPKKGGYSFLIGVSLFVCGLALNFSLRNVANGWGSVGFAMLIMLFVLFVSVPFIFRGLSQFADYVFPKSLPRILQRVIVVVLVLLVLCGLVFIFSFFSFPH